jgi:hypothetical protein
MYWKGKCGNLPGALPAETERASTFNYSDTSVGTVIQPQWWTSVILLYACEARKFCSISEPGTVGARSQGERSHSHGEKARRRARPIRKSSSGRSQKAGDERRVSVARSVWDERRVSVATSISDKLAKRLLLDSSQGGAAPQGKKRQARQRMRSQSREESCAEAADQTLRRRARGN